MAMRAILVVVLACIACIATTHAGGPLMTPRNTPTAPADRQVPRGPTSPAQDVKEVLLVSMCHLDVGFNHGEMVDREPCLVPPYATNCGWAFSIVNVYFDDYYPAAIATAQALRTRGGPERLIWTTHPWLLSMFFDCPQHLWPQLHCPDADALAAMEAAIRRGDISWHAGPFNMEPELMDTSMFAYSLSLGRDLATKFNVSAPTMMSQRDVPGMTQAVIPTLLEHGVKGVSVGVNTASSPPAVPPGFVWYDATGTQSVVGMEHKGGYGWMQGATPKLSDCAIAGDKALCFAFKGDNRGPQNVTDVLEDWAAMEKLFPGATVKAATVNDYVDALEAVRDSLPVVHDEIGDTWIYGSASDPKKTAMFRETVRARRECVDSGRCDVTDPAFQHFDRMLLKTFEHTWGMDLKFYLDDYTNWSNDQFNSVRSNSNFLITQESWTEQRSFINMSLTELGTLPFATEVRERIQALKARVPDTTGFSKVDAPTGVVFKCGDVDVGFDGNGAITTLTLTSSSSGPVEFASADHPLGQFNYQTYGPEDVSRFLAQYLYCFPPPLGPESCYFSTKDFGKPNIGRLSYVQRTNSLPTLTGLWHKGAGAGDACACDEFLAEMSMPSHVVTLFGAPATVWTRVLVPQTAGCQCAGAPSVPTRRGASPTTIDVLVEVQLFDKTPTRLPESLWVLFHPLPAPTSAADPGCASESDLACTGTAPHEWYVEKLGQLVNVDSVLLNGSKHLHSTDPCGAGVVRGPASSARSARARVDATAGPQPGFNVTSLDAGLVAPGRPSLWNLTATNPDVPAAGVSFNLANNLYDTNYPAWYPFAGVGTDGDEDLRFRFVVSLDTAA